MSFILTIDTSSPRLSIALQDDSRLIDSILLDVSLHHAKRITAEIGAILVKNKLAIDALAAIALNEGPGSFTGLRVGSSVAKGLCFGLNIPLISIKGLEAYALFYYFYFKEEIEDIFILLDARRDNYFYTHVKEGVVLQEISFKSGAEISMEIKKTKNSWVYKSNEVNEYYLEAKYLIGAVWSQFDKNQFEDISEYEPNYFINNYSKK